MAQICALLSTSTKELFKEDAIGVPSDAAQALEPGTDAVLANMADTRVKNPQLMTKAMNPCVEAVRLAYVAGILPVSPIAHPSGPTRDAPVQAAS